MRNPRTRDQARRDQRATEIPRGRTPRPSPSVLGPTPLYRARAIANGVLDALERADPAAAELYRAQAAVLGETWLGQELPPATGQRMTRGQVAALAGVRPHTVTTWVARELLTQGTDGLYDPQDVEDFLRDRTTTQEDQ